MNTKTRLTLVLLLTLVSARPVFLEAPQQNQASQPAKDTSELVMLDVLVRHRSSGKTVVGLNKQDFSIYEADVKQEIEEFKQDDSPASIVLLLDVSRSMDTVVGRIREGAQSAWRQFGPDDEVAIMTFAKNVEVVQPFTKDKQLVVDRIGKIYALTGGAARGQTNLAEAIYQAAVYLGNSSSSEHHRFVLVISDGQSNQQEGHSKKQALRALFACGGALYCLIVPDSPVLLPPGGYGLAYYAAETGGLSANVENFKLPYIHKVELDEKLGSLIALLHNRYRIAYRPSNSKLDGKYRRIKVKVPADVERRLGKLVIVTRRGYYAQ
jgi:VWFA-related protein